MVLGDVAAFHQDRLAVLQVDPVIGHRAPAERGPQTGDRGAMSKPGLVLDVPHTEQAGRLLKEVALLVGVLRAAHESHRISAIDGHLFVAALLMDEPWGACDPITRCAIHEEFRRIHLLGGDPRLVARLANLRATRATASSQEMSSQWSLPGAR